MRKHFILSTRTLVSKREVTQNFGSDNTVYVPLAVMEEIEEKYSDGINERGKIAREILAYLGSFHINDLKKGVIQPNGSILKVTTNYNHIGIPDKIGESQCSKLDKRILQTCLGIKEEVPENEKVILVSKKATLRKKAEMLGINAQTFRDELLPELSEQYTGRKIIHVEYDIIQKFRQERKISLDQVIGSSEKKDFFQNMFIEFRGKNSHEHTWECGRVDNENIIALSHENYFPYGVVPKNVGQKFMIEALMMDNQIAPLVIIKGPAGTAKTFLSLAAGLELVGKNEYRNKILISRSPTETGEKIGYLPGDEQEKIMPYLRSAMDNLAALHYSRDDSARNKKKSNPKGNSNRDFSEDEKPQYENGTNFFERGCIKAEAIGYIRGRSITDTFIIIDEAQNLTPVEMKTIITRISEGSKMIILGDPEQIDRPELDERNNGLSYASEHLKGVKHCWQITMSDEESVRSEIARIASIHL